MITSHKTFKVTCDHTSPDGYSCGVLLIYSDTTPSEWTSTGRISNRGKLKLHLRREGWTVGRTVLCPDHAGGAA